MKTKRETLSLSLLTAVVAVGVAASGCDNNEKMIDVETPKVDVEVQRDRDDGSIKVNVDR